MPLLSVGAHAWLVQLSMNQANDEVWRLARRIGEANAQPEAQKAHDRPEPTKVTFLGLNSAVYKKRELTLWTTVLCIIGTVVGFIGPARECWKISVQQLCAAIMG